MLSFHVGILCKEVPEGRALQSFLVAILCFLMT